MTIRSRLTILISLLIFISSSLFAQQSGDYLYKDNTVYFDEASIGGFAHIKEENESIGVTFTFRNTPSEVNQFINDLESQFKDRLLNEGFTLKGVGGITNRPDNRITLLVDAIEHDNHLSYLLRISLSHHVYLHKSDPDYKTRTIPVWKRMYMGYGNESNLKEKIKEDISHGLDQLMKVLETEW